MLRLILSFCSICHKSAQTKTSIASFSRFSFLASESPPLIPLRCGSSGSGGDGEGWGEALCHATMGLDTYTTHLTLRVEKARFIFTNAFCRPSSRQRKNFRCASTKKLFGCRLRGLTGEYPWRYSSSRDLALPRYCCRLNSFASENASKSHSYGDFPSFAPASRHLEWSEPISWAREGYASQSTTHSAASHEHRAKCRSPFFLASNFSTRHFYARSRLE